MVQADTASLFATLSFRDDVGGVTQTQMRRTHAHELETGFAVQATQTKSEHKFRFYLRLGEQLGDLPKLV